MLDLMYNLPSQEEISNFKITRKMVEKNTGAKVLPLPNTEKRKRQEPA